MGISTDRGDSDETKSTVREMVQSRAEDLAVSAKYTYDQHYSAANFYRYLDIGITLTVALLGTYLTIRLVWDFAPDKMMIASAIVVGGLEGVRLALSPSKKSRVLRQSAKKYHTLYEQVMDFMELEIPQEQKPIETLLGRYRDLNGERLELNAENPDLSSIWYLYIKYVKPDGGIDQTVASEAERLALDRGR